ncbi:hypothetical protein I7I50_09856 [Histoplasma capsulatum G186AR]|uniref:Uncharacterized protein n=1 Tax=Ajellomyces capsulatus TaxID=5037 RepID=A0A8H7YXA0_AJECA|nr:hypothetical protein I7I52_10827 [Histoplasma capsulatum]QSS68776.1 hypothetical protein I7I50_09856 [Histoplasma capsulatum G186AR]
MDWDISRSINTRNRGGEKKKPRASRRRENALPRKKETKRRSSPTGLEQAAPSRNDWVEPAHSEPAEVRVDPQVGAEKKQLSVWSGLAANIRLILATYHIPIHVFVHRIHWLGVHLKSQWIQNPHHYFQQRKKGRKEGRRRSQERELR